MKLCFITVLFVMAICASAVEQDDGSEKNQPLINCPGGPVVLLENGVSPDGRYGVGWTVRPGKGAKPVDWSPYKKEGREFVDDLLVTEETNYEIYNCFVNIREEKMIDLPSGNSYWWKENHAEYGVFWSSGTKLPRYCLMQNQKRFATYNLFLIKVDSSSMSQMDIVPQLEKAVRPLLRTLRPIYWKDMAISYPNSEWDDVYKEPVFHGATVDIQFNADLEKAGYDQVTGWITVSLPAGKVLKVACDAKRDDPFQDYPALAKADRELNDEYALLQKKLDPAARAKLKKEQLEWLKQRDGTAADDYLTAGMDVEVPAFTRERNNRLVDATRERTGVLKRMAEK